MLLCDWFKMYNNYTLQAQLERERERESERERERWETQAETRVNTQNIDCRPTKDQKG